MCWRSPPKTIQEPISKLQRGAVKRIDAAGRDSYIAVGGYGAANNRTQTNVVALRSFILDIDTNESGKTTEKYANRKEALKALWEFCEKLGIPKPLVVSSGYGLHCYHTMTTDVTAKAWKQTADLLKKATKKFELAVDPKRTCDEASVLRPIETNNYKRGGCQRVKLLHAGGMIDHAAFHLKLLEYVGEAVDDLGIDGTMDPRLAGDNADLSTPACEYPPSDASAIADKCLAMNTMRDTGGCVQGQLWYDLIGVLVRTTQGAEAAHEFSSGYPGYSAAETQSKVERQLAQTHGATKCNTIASNFPGCQSCKYLGTITSPIVLGEDATPAVATVQVTAQATPQIQSYPWPYGYGPVDGSRGREVTWVEREEDIEDGAGGVTKGLVKRKILDYKLVPTHRVATSDKIYSMHMRLELRAGHVNEFYLDCSCINEGGTQLFKELGAREVNLQTKEKPEVHKYLTAWVGHLRDTYASTPSITQYGWHGDGFIVGQDYIHAGGTDKAVVREAAANYAEYLAPSGDLDTWVQAVDQAYNFPGLEALQFCVLGAFAAPLWSLLQGEAGGVLVYAHSTDTGRGKTTAQKVGLSAWGNPAKLIRQEGNFTTNALYSHIGTMQNLPVVIDEFTNSKSDFASQLVYAVSAGQGKARMTQNAQLQKTSNWGTIVLASGNNLLTEKLSVHRADASAEMARVWEFTVTCKSHLTTQVAKPLFRQFDNNYGHAGRTYIEYVVANKDAITRTLARVQDQFDAKNNIAQGERYWSALHACVLTSLAICRKLDLVRFDQAAMQAWIKKQLYINRLQINENTPTLLDQFQLMLVDLGPGILVTIGDGKNGPAKVERHVSGPVTGRMILADQNNNAVREVLYISSDAAKKWCVKHSVAYEDMKRELEAQQIIRQGTAQVSLGKGTAAYEASRARSLEINPHSMRQVLGDAPLADKVESILCGNDDAGSRAVTGKAGSGRNP